ncbi:PAS domain-containing protein, partial [bacterium]|nr:PAS domain-containing protein [bacterium]
MVIDNYKRLQNLIANLEGFLYELDIETSKILFLAGKVEEITGYLKEDFYEGRVSWMNLVYPDDLARIEEEKSNLLSIPGYIARNDYRVINRSGDIRWVTDIATIMTHSEKTILQGFVQDITERKKIEIELKRREELLNSMFNSIQDGLSIL